MHSVMLDEHDVPNQMVSVFQCLNIELAESARDKMIS